MSKFCKAELATLAKTCVEVVRQAGLEGSELAFRHPVMAAPAPHQAGTLPPPETVWQGWEALRDNLPEASDNIIIKWLRNRGSLKGSTGRVIYRGLQLSIVLDLGALSGLVGVPCSVGGGVLHLRFL